MATMYSSRNSALLRRRRRRRVCSSVVVVVVLLRVVEEGVEAVEVEVLGSRSVSGSERKEKTWSSRRIQRRARVMRCGVEESWAGVGGGRYREMRFEPMS
jgi:hypothetical protein